MSLCECVWRVDPVESGVSEKEKCPGRNVNRVVSGQNDVKVAFS